MWYMHDIESVVIRIWSLIPLWICYCNLDLECKLSESHGNVNFTWTVVAAVSVWSNTNESGIVVLQHNFRHWAVRSVEQRHKQQQSTRSGRQIVATLQETWVVVMPCFGHSLCKLTYEHHVVQLSGWCEGCCVNCINLIKK